MRKINSLLCAALLITALAFHAQAGIMITGAAQPEPTPTPPPTETTGGTQAAAQTATADGAITSAVVIEIILSVLQAGTMLR